MEVIRGNEMEVISINGSNVAANVEVIGSNGSNMG